MASRKPGAQLAAILLALIPPALADEREYPEAERRALAVAAAHLEVRVEQLEVVAIEPVQWQDSSLGCPKPGRRYLPSAIAGYRVVVDHSGKKYQVHLGGKRGLVCEGILRKGP